MICWGFKISVIRKNRTTETSELLSQFIDLKDKDILLAKRKRYNIPLNLTLMTVIIYTENFYSCLFFPNYSFVFLKPF